MNIMTISLKTTLGGKYFSPGNASSSEHDCAVEGEERPSVLEGRSNDGASCRVTNGDCITLNDDGNGACWFGDRCMYGYS